MGVRAIGGMRPTPSQPPAGEHLTGGAKIIYPCRSTRGALWCLAVAWLVCFAGGRRSAADVYVFRDPRTGVVHFTNVPVRPGYGTMWRSSRRRGDERTYDAVMRGLSRRYGVEFALIKAVVKAESDFNPHALSPKGAQGLM